MLEALQNSFVKLQEGLLDVTMKYPFAIFFVIVIFALVKNLLSLHRCILLHNDYDRYYIADGTKHSKTERRKNLTNLYISILYTCVFSFIILISTIIFTVTTKW